MREKKMVEQICKNTIATCSVFAQEGNKISMEINGKELTSEELDCIEESMNEQKARSQMKIELKTHILKTFDIFMHSFHCYEKDNNELQKEFINNVLDCIRAEYCKCEECGLSKAEVKASALFPCNYKISSKEIL